MAGPRSSSFRLAALRGAALAIALGTVTAEARAADAQPTATTGASGTAGAAAAAGATPAVGPTAESKPPVVIWPTLTPAGDAPAAGPLHRPPPTDKDLYEHAAELDATLRDAVQDLGFTLFVADAGPSPGHTRDEDLIERAARSAVGGAGGSGGGRGGQSRGGRDEATGGDEDRGTWVVSPRLESAAGGAYTVRIVAVPPKGRELRVRVETVPADSVSVRGLVMLRDLLSPQAAAEAAIEQERLQGARGTTFGIMSPLRSQGRAVLAVSAGLFGAFTAFSLEASASGSSPDPRVLYPLLAVGTGIGIGGALLVADEWDVTTGDAWYLAAGGLWGAASGIFIADGRDVQPLTDRYSWGVGGGLIGVGLATFALTQHTMDDGDATLAHSGGALGMLLGGATQFLYEGSTTGTPYTGMGYGSAIGMVAAGVLATRVHVSPSRVLLIDVGAGGGALLGAAAASPLIVENQTPAKTRGWMAATLAGSVAGGLATWWLTRDVTAAGDSDHARTDGPARGLGASGFPLAGSPTFGVIGSTPTPRGSSPVYGLAWTGFL